MPADHQAGPITRGLLIVKPPIALVEVFQKLKFLGLARLLLDIEIVIVSDSSQSPRLQVLTSPGPH